MDHFQDHHVKPQTYEQEAALKEHYRDLFGSVSELVQCVNLQGELLYVNRAWRKCLGYSDEELPNLSFLDVIHPDSRDHCLELFQRVMSGQDVGTIKTTLVSKTGNAVVVEGVTKFTVLDGKPIAACGIFRDVTEQRQAQAEHERLATAIEQAAEAVVMTDLEGRILYVNPAFSRMTGYGRDEVLGQNPRVLKSGKHGPEFYQGLWQSPRAGSVWHGEIVNRRKDGALYDEEMIITPVRDAGGSLTGFIALKQDITARKQAEAQLQKAREAAEAANRAKSEFLANMNHEIRTPMNGVIGMTELALGTDLDAEQRSYLQVVRSSAESLLGILNDILDFSKIEAGKLDLDTADFQLRDTVLDALKVRSLQADQKGIELACDIDPAVPDGLTGDPGRLRQVIVNLVGNAVKFTQHGEVVVRAFEEPGSNHRVKLHFTVTDTGIGIAPKKQAVIFQSFTQANGSTTRKFGGTGLGLAISRHLIEMMGGRLWVESEMGRGSTFHFTAVFGRSQKPEATAPSTSLIRLEGVRVLVIDDNRTNRMILERELTYWGMRPVAAANAVEAMDALSRAQEINNPFRLILTDACMPDMDGFELVERIREQPGLAQVTIMMLSSSGMRGDVVRCRELQVAAYLTKPVSQRELYDAVAMVLSDSVSPGSQPAVVTRHSLRESRPSLRILLAEDNAVNQKLAVRLLEKRGHSITVTNDGREALEALEKNTFDLILMDVQMPVVDGLEAAIMIRTKEKATGERIPIIAMTAHAMKEDREKCLAAGMDGYITKPVKVQELLDAIDAAVPSRLSARPRESFSSATNPKPAPIVDRQKTLAQVEGDAHLVSEMVSIFLANIPKQIDAMRDAVEKGDLKSLARLAHSVKGSVLNFSAQAAANAALKLETAARQGNLALTRQSWKELQDSIEQVKSELSQWLPSKALPS